MPLRLGLNIGYSGAQIQLPIDLIQEADRLGFYAVWTAESYGSDAVTPLAWLGAPDGRPCWRDYSGGVKDWQLACAS